MTERFQVSKLNGTNPNFTTISEDVATNGNETNINTPSYQQNINVQPPRKSSRISFRGFGSFLKPRNSIANNDRKFSLAQLTQ